MNERLIQHLKKDVNMNNLERWLGDEKIEQLRLNMKGWYGRPIHLTDVPGSVWIDAQGNFRGDIRGGAFMSALDTAEEGIKRYIKRFGEGLLVPQHGQLNAGFASISDALLRASQGYAQRRPFNKVGPTGVVGVSSSLWRVGPQPAAGGAGAAAPGGTAHTSADTGALTYANPASGTNHLTGASVATSVISNTLLVYDRIFSVAKTMNSSATEAVTGVPSRYQSTVAANADYAGDNFLFVEVGGTALAATAHNWTVCTYADEGGNAATLPSLTGNASAIVDRLDHPVQQWFAPLATGDVGIQKLTQMQCSALVATGAINFVIGHPLGWMSFPLIDTFFPFSWLSGNDDLAPRIFDNACIAFLEPLKPATTATTYTGRIVTTNAAP